MSTMTSTKLAPEALFGGNPEARLAVGLLIDSSNSMDGDAMHEANAGLKHFVEFVKSNAIARNKLDVSILSFGGGLTIHCRNAPVDELQTPILVANGGTPMGEAILTGLELAEERKRYYKANHIDYFKPILICLTDGEPTDKETFARATEELKLAEAMDKVSFYCFVCNGASMKVMKNMGTKHAPVYLMTADLKQFFRDVSTVVSSYTDEDGQSAWEELTEE